MRLDQQSSTAAAARAMPMMTPMILGMGVKKKAGPCREQKRAGKREKKKSMMAYSFFFRGRGERKKTVLIALCVCVHRPTVIFEALSPPQLLYNPLAFFSRWFHFDFLFSPFFLFFREGVRRTKTKKNYRPSRHYKCTFFFSLSLSFSLIRMCRIKKNR